MTASSTEHRLVVEYEDGEIIPINAYAESLEVAVTHTVSNDPSVVKVTPRGYCITCECPDTSHTFAGCLRCDCEKLR